MYRCAVPLLAGVLAATPLLGQQGYQYETYTLDNGLRVILLEDHATSVVAINLWYDVGSRNERPGRSGFAHLFEHMMFQGSKHVQKGEHMQLTERAGGNLNGTTNEDRTAYFETLPSNRLNLGLWMEADRMRSLAVTDENFENQRETVKEERRMRVDNVPYGRAFSDGVTLPYDSTACFPYAHTVIGSMDDLNAAKTADVQAFFDLYYAPNNAILTVVGDFEPARARQLIQTYFGDIPRGRPTPPVECRPTYHAGERSRVFEDEHANLPAVLILYQVPPHRDPATRPLQQVATILGDGESSRLNRTLVRERRSALQAGTFMDSRRGPSVLIAFAVANQGVSADTLAAQLRAEVAKIVRDGVTADELEKAKNGYRAGEILGRQTPTGMASTLLHYAFYHDALDDINTDLDQYMTLTVNDLQRAAGQYLTPDNSYTVVVVPRSASGAGGGR